MSKLRVLTYANGNLMYLDGRVETVTISGDIATCFRSCEVSLINANTLRQRALNFELGKELRVLYDGKEVFRGVIFDQGIDTSGNQSLKAHDYNVYLIKNVTTEVFKDKTATQIISELCGKFGIQTGALANTGHVIKSQVFRGKSLYDIATIALTTTEKATGNKFRITNRDGKLTLVDVKSEIKSVVIENGKNLMDASYSETIEDVRTSVKLTGGDEEKPINSEASNGLANKYGQMQHYEHHSDVKDKSELDALAQSILADLSTPKREFDVTSLGDAEVTSGVNIAVRDAMTGIQGAFYVETDTHTFEANGTYTMSLKLSRTLDLPQMEADNETV